MSFEIEEKGAMAKAITYPLNDIHWQDRVISAFVQDYRMHKIAGVKYVLVWEAAPRPPVHPNYMTGRQSFASALEARKFFSKLASDARFISLTQVVTVERELSIV